MLKSMTGFAHKKVNFKGVGEFTIHLRSYNNRFLDINIKTGRGLEILEKVIYETVSKHMRRGRIDAYVGFTPAEQSKSVELSNIKKAKLKLNKFRKELNIKDDVSFNMLLNYSEREQKSKDALTKVIIEKSELVLNKAIKELVAYKKKQGVSIKRDLSQILNRLTKMNKSFELFLKKNIKDIDSISKDVFEEFSLISFYILQLQEMLKSKDERIGKKLDFLSQELLREVNTLQAKIKDKKISLQALYFKEEIERIREISNNIE